MWLRELFLTSSFLISRIGDAQIANYVTNGGFEQFLSCSGSNPNLGYLKPDVIGWDEIGPNGAAKWNHYCYGAVPWNGFFYNYPRSNSAYVIFDVFCLTCTPDYNRVNLRNVLKSPLIAGKTYCVKFHINIGEYSSYGIDAFDAYFGGSEVDTISYAHVPLTYLSPQISNAVNSMVIDTIGWTAIGGTFTATGNEKYMVIGNLRPDSSTGTVISNPSQSAQQWSACVAAIDDISCIPLDLPAFAGNDTTCVPGTTIYIGRQRDVGIDEACKWYKLPVTITPTTPALDTAAGIWVSPIQTSTYVVRHEICGVVKWDTVVIYKDGVGIVELGKINTDFSIQPNPANEWIQVICPASDTDTRDHAYAVTNSLGQIIMSEKVNFSNGNSVVDISQLPQGIYHFSVEANNGEWVGKKFVVCR
jgi:hypothetical protein